MWKETYDLVAQVPLGKITTYGEVAKALGDIVASRFVGLAMSMNDDIVRVPCRRVVQSDGFVGGYTDGGPEKKARLLKAEGIRLSGLRIKDLEGYLFSGFEASYPLRGLRSRQLRLKDRLDVSPFKGEVNKVAGIDVAYEGDRAFAAMVVIDHRSGKEVDRAVIRGSARFPYIPTYLAFREMPIIAPLVSHLDENTVVMYDGNGILHPEGFGIASQLGVLYGVRTVGVAKKLLCGTVVPDKDGTIARVVHDGKTLGHAVSKGPTARPVYVSVGHGLSPDQALRIAVKFTKHRVPEPTRQAHIAAEAARRMAKEDGSEGGR